MEITVPLDLSPEEESLVDMHSVFNVLNVISGELIDIGDKLDCIDDIMPLIEDVGEAGVLLRDPEAALILLEEVESFIQKVESFLDLLVSRQGPDGTALVAGHRENLRNVFAVVRIRAGEIRSRKAQPDEWVEHRISQLEGNFVQFLQAVEKNSHGQYRIVQNLADKKEQDYLIHFYITSVLGESLLMPIIFQDVMRDILANARKYTRPGGKIQGGLHYSDETLRYVVEDSGVGIPPEDIEKVVLFGKRAQNVLDRPTKGGGFGLTKAYYVTQRYGGRMWIESPTGKEGNSGTRVEIEIPVPKVELP